ncbi:MAG TPA: [Fe-Fe] hydrogenase large subunit C-terminal domain-containing protein [Clostridia bacterium]|nr:[Fe-Fe] hydrogenase large subunit C-terminal domain-containing protein [Clostridia bacterium]
MKSAIFTDNSKCMGCNKCIFVCPVENANTSRIENGISKTHVDENKCIMCGRCLDVCGHGARDYMDDTEQFMRDLAGGKKINLIAAPALKTNFRNYKRLIGFLSSYSNLSIYDVSLGADITTWAYLKAIKDKKLDSVISQPCPAIVNYIQKYQHDLIPRLAPVHSPMMCTAVYMKKYLKTEGDICFLSPCIAKVSEINDANTDGMVKYNVTFRKLSEYIKQNRIDLGSYPEKEFNGQVLGLGDIYSMPGGLKDNVYHYYPDAWVKQVEGTETAYDYLKEYSKRLSEGMKLPLLVDILSCAQGCNLGSGTEKKEEITDIELTMHELKLKNRGRLKANPAKLLAFFDKQLKPEDFVRNYTAEAHHNSKTPSKAEEEEIFGRLHKFTGEDRNRNCNACGYGSCSMMVKAIYNGYNHVENCIDYNLKVSGEKAEIERKNAEITKAMAELDRLSRERSDRLEKLKLRVADITNAIKGVSLATEENSAIAENISADSGKLLNISEDLKERIDEIQTSLNNFAKVTDDIVAISEKTNLLSLNASIEAARVGAAGQGFLVVANEVKKLAEYTKSSAQSTKQDELKLMNAMELILKIAAELEDRAEAVNGEIANITAMLQNTSASSEEVMQTADLLLSEQKE